MINMTEKGDAVIMKGGSHSEARLKLHEATEERSPAKPRDGGERKS